MKLAAALMALVLLSEMSTILSQSDDDLFSHFFPGETRDKRPSTSVHGGAKTITATSAHGEGPGKVSTETQTVITSSSVSMHTESSFESTEEEDEEEGGKKAKKEGEEKTPKMVEEKSADSPAEEEVMESDPEPHHFQFKTFDELTRSFFEDDDGFEV